MTDHQTEAGQTEGLPRSSYRGIEQFRRANILKSTLNGIIYSTINSTRDCFMAHRVLTETAASVSELKRDPMGTVAAGEGFPVAILNRNEPAFYCVPAKAYEALLERLDDLELNAIANQRLADGKPLVRVTPDEL